MFIETEDGEDRYVEDDEIGITAYHDLYIGGHTTDYEIQPVGAVTKELAERVYSEFQITLEDHGIDVIDPDDPEVTVL